MTSNQRLLVLATFSLVGCKDLPDVQRDVCGNGVLEAGEDCEAARLDDGGVLIGQCGDPEGANACFYECVPDVVECPPSYGCGVDGRCRQASGLFVGLAELTLAADQLAAGDVDGDGIDDLIAASGTSIEVDFGSPQGDFAAVDTLVATPERGVTVGDLDMDGADDLLIGTTPGIQTFLGSSDRVLDPFSYPIAAFEPAASFALGASIDIDDTLPNDEVLLAWANQIGFPVIGETARRDLPDPIGPVEGIAPNLMAPLPVARLAYNRALVTAAETQDPTVEIALGYGATQQIFVFQAAGAPPRVLDTGVILDAGLVLNGTSGMMFGYFDGDDCIDLVAHRGVVTGELVVFRNTAGGSTGCTGTLQAAQLMASLDPSERLLAVADFDGDGVTDLVTSRGVIHVAGTGPWTLSTMAIAGAPYEGAQVVDINGDGALDVGAFREGQPDVDVLINAGVVFNRFVVATTDPVQRLAAGDFDGDLTPDLAIIELDSSGVEAPYAVSVSFGQFHGPPGARVVMDHFELINGVVSASLIGATGEPDAVADLVVLENEPDGAEPMLEATVLFGSGARSMTSPLTLQGTSLETPEAFVLGQFDGAGAVDLFAVGDGGTAFLFLGEAGELTEEEDAPWPGEFEVSDAVWASGNVDGQGGTDEIAAAERNTVVPGAVRVILFAPDPAAIGADVVIATLQGYFGAHALRIADLDGDDDLDVLLALDPLDDRTGTLRVGWNHDGVIDDLAPLPDGDGCIDAVPIALDGDDRPELVALCRDPEAGPLDRNAFRLVSFHAHEPDTLLFEGVVLGDSNGGRTTHLLAADVDGDGLQDLIISTRGDQAAGIRVFRQTDVHENE